MPALFQQFCQSVWLCVERLQLGDGSAHGTQNEHVWLLNTQPLLSLDLVSLEPNNPSLAQIHCRVCTQAKRTSANATASVPSALACCHQLSILDRAARLHDLRHLLRDQHLLLHGASSTSP